MEMKKKIENNPFTFKKNKFESYFFIITER